MVLIRIEPTFAHAKQVLLTGVSAGGFGAALTADLVGRTFPPGTTFTLIDDSGPPMSSQYLPTCLQRQWRELWGFDFTFLADCGSDCPDHDDYALDWVHFLTDKYPKAKAGLISATADIVITAFYGYGNNNCAATALSIMNAADFKAGLMDFRDDLNGYANFGTYYIDSSTHTWISADNSFYNTTSSGVRLVDWFRGIVDGTSVANAGP